MNVDFDSLYIQKAFGGVLEDFLEEGHAEY